MSLRIDLAWLVATVLVSVRVAGATMIAPVLGPSQIPAPARVLLVMGLSAFMVAAAPGASVAPPLSSAGFMAAVASEAALGFMFAFGFIAAYGATQLAGRALDVQVGFGAAGILNPATRDFSPLLGAILGMLLVAVFLALDGHLVLLKALALSLAALPPGALLEHFDVALVLKHSAASFSFGLALAAPVMFMLLLSDLAMAVFARSMPQLNIFVLGFAVKIVLGLSGLAISIRYAQGVLEQLLRSSFGYWDGLASGS